MVVLKKILTPFILPPGVFIAIIAISSGWLFYKKKWRPGILSLILVSLAWALSISPISDAMIRGLESEYNIPKIIKGDVIILLGRGVSEKAPDLSGIGVPSGDYFTRIVTAVRLQKMLNIPIIVSGAEGSDDKVAEDHIVGRFLKDLGVSPDNIILEDKSGDTYENAKFSKDICVQRNFSDPILVTSAYHMKRAVWSFRNVGLNVKPFPSGYSTWEDKEYGWQAYLPGSFEKASIAISEYLGWLYYQLYY